MKDKIKEIEATNIMEEMEENLKEVEDKKTKKQIATKFADLDGKFLLVRVGDNLKPAKNEDIEEIEGKLTKLFEENNVNCLVFVTHHAVDIKLIEKTK